MFSCSFDFLTPIVKLVFEDEFIHLMDYFKNGKTTIVPSSLLCVRNWSFKFQVSTIVPSSFKNERY